MGHFFNEKEAKLVCLVLPAGCHYGPLESSLREQGPLCLKCHGPLAEEPDYHCPLSRHKCASETGFQGNVTNGQRISSLCFVGKGKQDGVIRECICLDLSEQLGRSSHFALILFEALPYKS